MGKGLNSDTPLKKTAIIKAITEGNTIGKACEIAGASRAGYYDWRRNDPEFVKAIEEAENSRITYVEDSLFAQARNGRNITATIFFLCNRNRDKWKNVNKVEAAIADESVSKIFEGLAELLKK
jgi:hypothetical protein